MENNLKKLNFVKPQKLINSVDKHQSFINKKTYSKIIKYITDLQLSVYNFYKLNDEKPKNNNNNNNYGTNCIKKLLNKAKELINKNQPKDLQKQRFGNVMFRTWYDELEKYYDEEFSKDFNEEFNNKYMKDNNVTNSNNIKSTNSLDISDELKPYFFECFGNSKRIDYGTGHELNFILILLILTDLKFFEENNKELLRHLVQDIFYDYISICKKLQTVYNLEPAGSKGVYGLDDYFFIWFIFGSAELVDNNSGLNPKDIKNNIEELNKLSKTYAFFDAVYYKLKSSEGSLEQHSPVLFQISNVPLWSKITNGLIKMWEDELLKKFVVCQHIYFGSVLMLE